MHDIKRIREIVTQSCENTNCLLKELAELKKKVMEDRNKIVKDLREKGHLDDILSYLKEEADKGDQVSLNVFNLWKYSRLPN